MKNIKAYKHATDKNDIIKSNNYELSVVNEVLNIVCTVISSGDELNVNLDLTKKGYFYLYACKTNNGTIVSIEEPFMFTDRYTGIRTYAREDSLVARIIVTEDEVGVFIPAALDVKVKDGIEIVELDDNYENGVQNYVSALYPTLKEIVEEFKTKCNLSNNIDYYDSLSYLEAQVDCLTELVLSLAEGKTLSNGCIELLKEARNNTVIDIKPFDALKEEVVSKKGHFRTIQETYYTEKY